MCACVCVCVFVYLCVSGAICGDLWCQLSIPVRKYATTMDTEGFQSAAASIMEGHQPPSSLAPRNNSKQRYRRD